MHLMQQPCFHKVGDLLSQLESKPLPIEQFGQLAEIKIYLFTHTAITSWPGTDDVTWAFLIGRRPACCLWQHRTATIRSRLPYTQSSRAFFTLYGSSTCVGLAFTQSSSSASVTRSVCLFKASIRSLLCSIVQSS